MVLCSKLPVSVLPRRSRTLRGRGPAASGAVVIRRAGAVPRPAAPG